MFVRFHDYPFNIAKECITTYLYFFFVLAKNLDKVLLPFNTYYRKPQLKAQANLLGGTPLRFVSQLLIILGLTEGGKERGSVRPLAEPVRGLFKSARKTRLAPVVLKF